MNLLKADKFIDEVISYIKFPFDREDIKKELEDHIHDKIDYYFNTRGIDAITAEELTLRDMGNPKEIGIALNKEHNFILGWIYKITNALVIIFLSLAVLSFSVSTLSTILTGNPKNDIPKENIVYNIEVNEKVKIDDRVIKFKNVIYEKDGDMNIVYEYYDTKLFGLGWSLGDIGTVKDNLGNEYFERGGSSYSGEVIIKGVIRIRDFANEADTLIIEYDMYNRYYKVEVPLKAGDSNE